MNMRQNEFDDLCQKEEQLKERIKYTQEKNQILIQEFINELEIRTGLVDLKNEVKELSEILNSAKIKEK